MRKLFYFIAGVIFVTLISATTVSVMTVKPQKPKITLVQYFRMQEDAENIKNYISKMIKSGWQLKEVEGANDGKYASTWIVVMEKY